MYDTWELLDTLNARVALLWILAGRDPDVSVPLAIHFSCTDSLMGGTETVRRISSWRGAVQRIRAMLLFLEQAMSFRKRLRSKLVSRNDRAWVSALLITCVFGQRKS